MKKLKNPYSRLNYLKEINPNDLGYEEDLEISQYLEENHNHRVLNCGSRNTSLIDNRITHLDIFRYEVIDIIADASFLPFKENSFDAIFCQAMLEHVKNPFQLVQEFTKVFKEDGYVSVSVPFLFRFHDFSDHYFNTSTSGIQSLFSEFQPIKTEVLLGPWYALTKIIGNYKKMLKRVYKHSNTKFIEKLRVFFI